MGLKEECIDMIKQLGIEVYKNSDETEDEVVVTITLPKQKRIQLWEK